MPTYEDLRSYFQESGALREVAGAASAVRIVSGFTLDVNPLWSLFYDLENDLLDWPPELDWWPGHWREFIDYYFDGPFRWSHPTGNPYHPWSLWSRTRYQGYRRRDLYKRVEMWDRLASRSGAKRWSPVTLTIVHRPIRPPLLGETTNEVDDQEELRRLVALARASPTAVRVEERPAARLALATGDGIQASGGKSGTLGGVLADPATGKSYGVTCAHVATGGNTISDSTGNVIGTCTADTPRVVLPGAAVCDPINLAVPWPSPGNGPDVNMLDCALIELGVAVARSKIAGVAKTLSPGQNVVLQGACTRTTHHKLGSLCLSYSFSESGSDYCFRDAIEILPQPWGPFGGTLGQLMTTVPTQGDSGGWVLTNDQPPYWAGLFFGEDGHRGFAIRASWVHDWARSATGCNLIL